MLYSDQQGSSSGHSSDSQSPEDIDIDSELLPDAGPEADREAAEAGAERREAQDLGIDVYPATRAAAGAAAGTVAVSAGGSSSGAASTSSARAQQQGGKRRYVGVRQRPSGRWVAEIKDTTHKIRLWLGTFNNPEDAARAYDDAARTLRGANTRTNFTRPVGTRPGFSSNSVRLLLQKAVEAAAVAGNLDSGGVLPSVAAAHAAGAAAAAAAGVVGHGLDVSSSSAAAGVPSSFNATPAGGPQDADPSNYMSLGGLNPHADLDLAMEAGSSRDVFSSSAMATDHLFAPGRHGISRSASYDHATMMRSQLQAPGSSSQSSLYSSASFSGDFDFSTGSQAAVTHASVGAFDLQQMQISNAGQVLQHPGATASSDQYPVRPPISIYKSLREKLGYAGGAAVGDSLLAFPTRPGHHHGEGSATAFAVPRPGSGAAADLDRVDSMDLSWTPMMRPTSGHAQGDAASLIHHWSTRSGSGATTDMMMRVHDHEQPGLAMEVPSVPGGRTHDQSGAAAQVQLQAPESMSWDQHASVAAASRHETAAVGDHLQVDERFGMEEISVVNWGHLATASSTADAASGPGDRMDTLSPLNWEDLGTPMATTSSEQRPVERPTTINWGDLISGTTPGTSMASTATVEAQGMEGITSSWGNVERGQRGPAHHHGGMDFHAGQGLQATTGFAPAPASWTTSGHAFFTAPASASHGYELDRSYQFSTRPAGLSSQEYWGAEAAAAGHDHASAVANLDLRAPHDHEQSTHMASQSGSISAQSAPNHPPAAEVAGSRAASYDQDDGWQTTSSRHPPYVQRAAFHPTDHGARLLNLHDQQQPPTSPAASYGQEEDARSVATFQGSGSEQHQDTQLGSGAAVEQVQQGGDASSAETQQELQETLRLLDYTTIDPSSCDANSSLSGFLPHTPADQSDAAGLNFLMLSPGFFRVDSFPRQHRPLTTSSSTAAANVLAASVGGDAATQRAADLDQDAHLPSTATVVPADASRGSVSTIEARRDDSQESRRLPPALTGSGTPAAPEVSTQPTAGSSSESDPTLTLAHARPKLLRNNAGCLPEVTRDGPDGTHGRSLPSTGSQVIGEEAVRSQLMLAMGGSMISTQELVAATRSVSSGDPGVVHAPPSKPSSN